MRFEREPGAAPKVVSIEEQLSKIRGMHPMAANLENSAIDDENSDGVFFTVFYFIFSPMAW